VDEHTIAADNPGTEQPIERIVTLRHNRAAALVGTYQSLELPSDTAVAYRAACLGCRAELGAGGADLDVPADWVTADQADSWAAAHAEQCAQPDGPHDVTAP
jgi:hypothetical protein